MEDLLKVGVITTTHGIRGEVKVYPTTDADRFLDLEYVLLDTGREKRKLEIENVKYFKNLVILKFRGIDNINDIEMYKKRELWIPREEAQELEEDEYYIADLIGMDVVLEDGSKFGTLKDVMETGANDNLLYTYESQFSVAETMARIEQTLKKMEIPVFAKFDHGKNAEEVGLELRPNQVIVFGLPKLEPS